MATPTIVFRNQADTTNLPQSGTSYFDWNATDGAGGTSDSPNPLAPNSVGNKQYVKLKNTSTATNTTASFVRFYINGTDATSLASLKVLRVEQNNAVKTITSAQGTSYSNGIHLEVGNGTDGDAINPNSITGTITLYAVTTSTGIDASNWSFVAGYYYVP